MRIQSAERPNSASEFLPAARTLAALRRAAPACRGCELYERATQVVMGEGPAGAALMVVGEIPGDQEDLEGKPFVGPAGRLLDEALATAGVNRREIFVTNAVKHFHWKERGKWRLHARPSARQVSACRPWLSAEIEIVSPSVIVCLGAVAARSLLGAAFRITRSRGKLIRFSQGRELLATWHPSAVLRAPDRSDRDRLRDELFRDLALAAARAAQHRS